MIKEIFNTMLIFLRFRLTHFNLNSLMLLKFSTFHHSLNLNHIHRFYLFLKTHSFYLLDSRS